MPKRQSKPRKAVHRNLHLVSPQLTGPDVRALQAEVNAELRHRKLEWRCIKANGEFGPRTLHACAFLGWVLGFSRERWEKMTGHDHPRVDRSAQRILRDPSKRSALDHAREAARQKEVRELRHQHNTGPALAVRYIEGMAAKGVHEEGETNTGSRVDVWEAFFGLHAQPWCGCLAGYAAKKVGGSTASTWFPYGPSIMADARAHRNGVREVSFDDIEAGDILVLWNGEHVVTATERPKGDSIRTGEGNTSPNDGDSQADGGCVAIKVRSRSDVSCVARVYG